MICKKIKISLLLMLLVIMSACGYRFAGAGKLPEGVEKICVVMFENRTTETGLERTVTNAVIYEFSRNGVSVLKERLGADAVLEGTITALREVIIAQSSERRITFRVDLKLMSDTGKVIWSRKDATGSETYIGEGQNDTLTRENRNTALDVLSKRIAELAYQSLTLDF